MVIFQSFFHSLPEGTDHFPSQRLGHPDDLLCSDRSTDPLFGRFRVIQPWRFQEMPGDGFLAVKWGFNIIQPNKTRGNIYIYCWFIIRADSSFNHQQMRIEIFWKDCPRRILDQPTIGVWSSRMIRTSLHFLEPNVTESLTCLCPKIWSPEIRLCLIIISIKQKRKTWGILVVGPFSWTSRTLQKKKQTAIAIQL